MTRVKRAESIDVITASVFAAYLKCPTKAVLLACGETSFDTFFTDIGRNTSLAYKAKIKRISSVKFCELAGSSSAEMSPTFVDSETAFYTRSIEDHRRVKRPKPAKDYLPILYSAFDRVEQSDQLIVSFWALAIAQAMGTEISQNGKIIFGAAERVKTVSVAELLASTRQTVNEIAKELDSKIPRPVVLNKHCSVCDFRSRCRDIAINREDLSLLGAMTEKERAKCREKGISTITQLSYASSMEAGGRRCRVSRSTNRWIDESGIEHLRENLFPNLLKWP
jgi:CRISPR/Cas system-associated exonuclease Cas4 (RecB family)